MMRNSAKARGFSFVASSSIAVAAIAALLSVGWFSRHVAADNSVSGEAVYREYCASCHDHPAPRVPPRSALQALSAARILRTLDAGVMMRVAYGLQRNQREAVANYLGKANDDSAPPAIAFCADRKFLLSENTRPNWTGWSSSLSNDRFQPPGAASLTVEQVRNLKLKWAFGFAGDITAYAAPTIYDGVLFVGSAGGVIHAMNAKTGCLYWTFQAAGPVRAATTIAPNATGGHAILFPDQIGSFYALDAETGRLLWKRRIDEHEATRLTGSAVVHDGVVFVPAASWEETRSGNPKYECCTFRGSLSALRIRDGSVVWKTYTVDPPKKTGANKQGTPQFGPSGAGIWSAPTIDAKRGVVYVTTGDNYTEPTTKTSDAIIALDLKTGKIVWVQQVLAGDFHSGGACPDDDSKCGPDYDFGSSAILVHPGGRDVLVAGQKSAIVYALDPNARGKILWQASVGKGGMLGGVQWGMASDGDNVYAAVADAVGVEDPEGGESPPVGGGSFDPAAGGGLTALRLTDGNKTWFALSTPCAPASRGCSPAQSGAVSAIAGAVFSGSMDGHIRAFSTADGKLLWDFDTEKDFSTVNGITAHGGSLDGAGPIIVDGMVYVNSGYPRFGGAIGNVLLAFAADDEKAK
jgi:polyvinyl alcohol dehydrogenase (cytochrome)